MKRRIFSRLTAFMMAVIMIFGESVQVAWAAEVPDVSDYGNVIIEDADSIIVDEPVSVGLDDDGDNDNVYVEDDDLRGAEDILTDPVISIDNSDPEIGSRDDSDEEPAGIEAEETESEETDAEEMDAEESETIEAPAPEGLQDIKINPYVLNDGPETLTGVFALMGDEEYTWNYADSTDKVRIEASEKDDTVTLDIYTECGYTFDSSLIINDHEYEVPEWQAKDYIDAVSFIDGIPYVKFSVDVEAEEPASVSESKIDPNDDQINVGFRLRPVTEEESFMTTFSWSNDPEDKDEDRYLGDVYISLLSLKMPEDIDAGRTYDMTDAAAIGSGKLLPGYVSYSVANTKYTAGTLIMPKGSEVTMKILPRHGYQVSEFELDEAVVNTPEEDEAEETVREIPADTDVYSDDSAAGCYTLTTDKTVFRPALKLSESGDTVVTDDAENVVSGQITIETLPDELSPAFPGTARLEVTDVPENGDGALTDEQIEAFEQAADEAVSEFAEGSSGAQIIDYFDISLYSVVNKAQGQPSVEDADIPEDGSDDELADDDAQTDDTEQEVWESEIKNPETSVKVTLNLNLDPETETEGLQVLHQKEVIVDDEVTYEYEVVPSVYNAEEQTITFEAESFSVYAISITGSYSIYIEATIKGENVRRPANTIDQAIALITSKTGFNGFKGEYRMFLGQTLNYPYLMSNDITLPSCVTKFVIVPFHESSSDPRQYMSMIKMNGKTFKSDAPVVIDGAVIFDGNGGGHLTAPSLELTRLSALVVDKLTVSGTTTLNGGSYLLIDGNTTLGAVKVYEDYELNDSGVVDKTKPLKKPAIYRYKNAVLNINGAITAGNENAGLRMGISADPYWTVSTMIGPGDISYDYTNTRAHAFTCRTPDSIDAQTPAGLVFYTTQKSVPVFISVEDSTKTVVYLDTAKNAVFAAKPKYTIDKCTLNADGTIKSAETIAQYYKYTDAAAGVSALNDAEATYRLNIYEDLSDSDNPQVIAFPKKAQKMIYSGTDASGNASLKYTTSTKLPCDITFEDLQLYISDKNGKQLSPYTVATIDIAGHRLDFDGEWIRFSSPVTFNDSAKKGTFRIGVNTKVATAIPTSWQETVYGCTYDSINPLAVDASKPGSSELEKEKQIDPRAAFNIREQNVSILAGSITNVGTLIIPEGNIIVMADYQTKKDTWTAPTFTANTLNNHGQLWLVTENSSGTAKGTAKATVTNCHMHGTSDDEVNNELKADAVAITNLYLMGNGWVESRGAFDVTNLTSFTDGATLATMRNEANKSAPNTPFLNVSGTVILQNPDDRVSVYVKETVGDHVSTATLEKRDGEKSPSGSMALLTTKNGTGDQFVPYHAIDSDGNGQTNIPRDCWKYFVEGEGLKYRTEINTSASEDNAAYNGLNPDGFFLKKTGSTIHLYEGSDVAVAVVTFGEEYYKADYGITLIQVAQAASADIDFYPSWADAVAGVNAKKTKANYEFVLIKDIGSQSDPSNKPIALTFPASANIQKLVVAGNDFSITHSLLYTNALTLTSDTVFYRIKMAPVAYCKAGTKIKYPSLTGAAQQVTVDKDTYANTAQPIKLGVYDLDLFGVSQAIATDDLGISPGDKGLNRLTQSFFGKNVYVPWISSVSGNGKNTVSMDVDHPVISGTISGVNVFEGPYGYPYFAADINVTTLDVQYLNAYCKNIKAATVKSHTIVANNTNFTVGSLVVLGNSETSWIGSLTADEVVLNYDSTKNALDVKGKATVKKLELQGKSSMTVQGDTKITDTLTMGDMYGGSTLEVGTSTPATLTINNIESKKAGNKIKYGSNSKKTTALTISGTVTGPTLGLEYYPDEAIATADLEPTVSVIPATAKSDAGQKVTFTGTSLIANIGTAPTEAFTVNVDRSGFTVSEHTPVKYAKGLYMPRNTSVGQKVCLKRTDSEHPFTSYYADWSQAITEIYNINDKDASYEMIVEAEDDTVDDTVITDGDPYGALAFPGKDKMKSLTVKGNSPSRNANIYYAGSVTGYNDIKLEKVRLINLPGNKSRSSERGKGNATFDRLKLNIAELWTDGDFKVNHMEVLSQSAINFKKNATITDLILNGNKNAVVFYGNATITNLTANSNKGSKGITFKAKATITNLNLTRSDVCFESNADITNLTTDNRSVAPGTAVNSVITATTKNLTGPSLLNIKGTVTGIAFIRLRVPVTRTDASGNKYTEYVFLENAEGYSALSYVGIQLALAPVADAASFYAYGLFVDSETGRVKSDTTHVSYKDGSKYVINDNLDYMLVKVEDVTMGAENAKLVTYARTWNDAVSFINNANNKNVNYRITFLKKGVWRPNAVVCEAAITDKKNQVVGSYTGTEGYDDTNNIATAAYGKSDVASLTWPKATAANHITINKSVGETVTLIYKGSFAPTVDCNVASNIKQYTTKKDTNKESETYNMFIPAKTTALIVADGKELVFDQNTGNYAFTTVTGTKGTITLPKNSEISGDLKAGTINTHDLANIKVKGKTSVGTYNNGPKGRVTFFGDASVTDLKLSKKSELTMDTDSNGKLTIGTIVVGSQESSSDICEITAAPNTVTINDIISESGTPGLKLEYYFTTPTSKAPGKSTLSINGKISGVNIKLITRRHKYDEENRRYSVNDDGKPVYTKNDADAYKGLFSVSSSVDPYKEYEGKTTVGKQSTWNTSMGWYDRRLLTMGKAAITGISVDRCPSKHSLYKNGSALYLAGTDWVNTSKDSILVEGFSNATWSDTYKTYEGTFFSYDEAIKEVDRIGSKTESTPNSCVRITLQKDLGTESDPVKALPLPANVREFKLTGGTASKHIYTTVTSLQVKAHATFENLEIDPRAMSKGSKVYDSYTTYSIAAGKNNVVLDNCVTKTTYGTKFVKDITCASLTTEPTTDLYMTGKIQTSEDLTVHGDLETTSVTVGGLFTFYPSVMKSVYVSGNVSAGSLYIYNRSMSVDGTVNVKNKIRIDRETSGGYPVLRVKGAVTAGDLIVLNVGTLQTLRDLTVNNASISGAHHFDYPDTWEGSKVVAGNITVKQTATLDGRSTLLAGTAYVGDGNKTVENKAKDGKITIKDVIVSRDYDADEPGALLSVKRAADNNKGEPGASQLNITGTVTCTTAIKTDENKKEPIQIGVRENTAGGGVTGGGDVIFTNNVEFTDGMLLVTAPMASDRYFRPSDGMKEATVNASSPLKTGKIVKKGTGIILTSENPVVTLREFRTVLTATGPKAKTAEDVNGDGVIDQEDGNQYVNAYYLPQTEFLTYEDAVNQINTYNRFKMFDDNNDGTMDRASQYYEDYRITFLRGNHATDKAYEAVNNKGAYVALPLPTKVGELTLSRASSAPKPLDLRFSGGVTLKSHLVLQNGINLVPRSQNKTSKKYEDATSAVNLGSYRLRLITDREEFDSEYTPIRPSSLTGGKGSQLELTTEETGGFVKVECTGNLSVPYLALMPGGDTADYCELTVGGNMSVTELYVSSENPMNSIINIDGNGTFTNIQTEERAFLIITESVGKPIKVNGTVNRESENAILLRMNTINPPAGTIYTTGSKLMAADWLLGDNTAISDPVYYAYMNGSNLVRGGAL